MKDFMFVSLMRLSRFFLIICGAFMWVSKAFERRAYAFRPKLCLEDGICLNNSLIPYYSKNKMGKKLVEFATHGFRPVDAVEKVGAVSFAPEKVPNCVYMVAHPEDNNFYSDKIPRIVKDNLSKITPVKKTFYNLKEDEYDKRAQEMVDRAVEEINKETGTV